MIEEYRSELLSFYEKKKASGKLSMNLMHPTCANIRNEFRLLYNTRCNNEDKRILKEFLEIPFDKELTDLTVKKCDTEKFKSLCNFLQKGIKTREKTIELLAWLMDFHPRPFSNYWRLTNGKTDVLSELSITESGIVEENKEEALYDRQHSLQVKKEHSVEKNNDVFKTDYWIEKEADPVDHTNFEPRNKLLQKEVTLEYPSGVKLYVDASDINLIAKLVRL
ncbi:hypothetical protein [Pedobacter cryoconitis]|uniref:Uncharacterized protein n=1 Tax=Pedobacter cryoconitis TaxID=188932 RepID=A0A327SS91_9SPHI|nr:hypothetical protein [Pedobacter cryoconitis]RAJ31738.1 hypothetical protein LY11_02238 [Pedobacter cryoconitis]